LPPTPRAAPLSPLAPQIRQFARRELIDQIPQPRVDPDRRVHSGLVFGTHVQRVPAPVQLNSEKLPSVPSAWIVGAGAVRTTAPAQALNQRAAHQRLEAQGAQLLAQPAATTLRLYAIRWHI